MKRLWIYRLAVVRGSMYCAWIGITAFRTATETHMPFPQLSPWDKFLVILGVCQSAIPVLLAFLDKTVAKLSGDVKAEDDAKSIHPTVKTVGIFLLLLIVIYFGKGGPL